MAMGSQEKRKLDSSLVCSVCQKGGFKHKYSLSRHMTKVHQMQGIRDVSNSLMKCLEDECYWKGKYRAELMDHLKNVHRMQFQTFRGQFPSVVEFQEWCNSIEEDGEATHLADGIHGMYKLQKPEDAGRVRKWKACSRSGKFHKEGKSSGKRLRGTPSSKIGSNCTFCIQYIMEPDGSVTVEDAVLNHYGHPIELKHTFLNKDDRAQIAHLALMGVSYDKILKKFREDIGLTEFPQRKHLLERRDIHNIVRAHGILTDFDFDGSEVLNQSLTAIGQSPVEKRKLERSQKYGKEKVKKIGQTVAKKLKLVSPSSSLEEPASEPKDDKDESEIIKQLKEIFSTCQKRSEKLQVLTVLPESWPNKKIEKEFGVTNYMARQSKKLVKEKGIMSLPNPREARFPQETMEENNTNIYKSDSLRKRWASVKLALTKSLGKNSSDFSEKPGHSDLVESYFSSKTNMDALTVFVRLSESENRKRKLKELASVERPAVKGGPITNYRNVIRPWGGHGRKAAVLGNLSKEETGLRNEEVAEENMEENDVKNVEQILRDILDERGMEKGSYLLNLDEQTNPVLSAVFYKPSLLKRYTVKIR